MTLRLAVTRAAPEAEASAARLRQAGADAIAVPLLTIVPAANLARDCAGAQALLFTSANGVRAFGFAPGVARVLTVGAATADLARATGYENVMAASGDSRALAALAIDELDRRAGRVIHVSGEDVTGDVAGMLAAAGFEAERRIAYKAVAASTLPPALDAAIEAGSLDRVLFYSARAAHVFLRLASHAAPNLACVAFSQVIATAAEPARWARMIVSSAPREDAMLAAALAR